MHHALFVDLKGEIKASAPSKKFENKKNNNSDSPLLIYGTFNFYI
jgi:hypothetical protein